jgi:hypothetical protein
MYLETKTGNKNVSKFKYLAAKMRNTIFKIYVSGNDGKECFKLYVSEKQIKNQTFKISNIQRKNKSK